jgi:tetratricopeptide (TPR) repeat protein
MAGNRLEILKSLVAQNPADCRTRYMLAMELANAGELEGAVKEYEGILAADADYVAAYFHGGQALERLGRLEEARAVYQRGIEAATRTGNEHTKSEIQAVLDMLG